MINYILKEQGRGVNPLCPIRNPVRMNVSPVTKLYKHPTSDYKSCAPSSHLANGSSGGDVTCDVNKNHGETMQVQ